MFFLIILIFILIIGVATYNSRIGIEIENLEINIRIANVKSIDKKGEVYLYLLVFNKIKLFKKNIKEIKLDKLKIPGKDIGIKALNNKDLKIDYKELLQSANIEKIDLYAQIGTENAAITAILVGIISSILGIIIKKPRYQVVPLYIGENLFKIKLEGIFTVNLIHYIYKSIFNEKGRDDKNERTSNRKSYDNCYE